MVIGAVSSVGRGAGECVSAARRTPVFMVIFPLMMVAGMQSGINVWVIASTIVAWLGTAWLKLLCL